MPYHFFATTLREPLREQSGRKRLLFKKLIKHECRVMVLFFQPTPLFTCKLEEVLVHSWIKHFGAHPVVVVLPSSLSLACAGEETH